MLFRLPCCLFSSLYQLWQRKLTLSSKLQTCYLWYFGMHNLSNRFWLSSLKNSHPVSIFLQIWHTELHSSYLLFNNVSFEPYVLKFRFLSRTPSRFLFVLAFPFLLQPWQYSCQPLLDIFQMLWQMVFLSVFYLYVDVI
jgi:hypothetical protein